MKILQGFQVVTISLNLPGPAACRRLVQLGASVTKVEPLSGDPMELYHADWYRDLAAGQTVVPLDVKSGEGKERLAELLTDADLLVTSSRPMALERLGLGWENLHQKYPRLSQVAIVGYPAPRDNEGGHDLTYQASLGMVTPPHLPRTLMADMAGAEQCVSASLALLLGRERGLGPGYAEVALSEAAATMAEPLRYKMTAPGALLGGALPEYNIFEASDGWIAVAALEPHFKKRLEEDLEVHDLAGYRKVFGKRSVQEWQQWGLSLDVPVAAVHEAHL